MKTAWAPEETASSPKRIERSIPSFERALKMTRAPARLARSAASGRSGLRTVTTSVIPAAARVSRTVSSTVELPKGSRIFSRSIRLERPAAGTTAARIIFSLPGAPGDPPPTRGRALAAIAARPPVCRSFRVEPGGGIPPARRKSADVELLLRTTCPERKARRAVLREAGHPEKRRGRGGGLCPAAGAARRARHGTLFFRRPSPDRGCDEVHPGGRAPSSARARPSSSGPTREDRKS